jgi:tripartite-type tricarboxylate transporter receptor subunit TctC
MANGVRVLAAVAILALSTVAQAQPYPVRPVRLIVPFAPGGVTDVMARILAAKLTEVLRQQVIADNRAGGGGNIGYGIAANAAPDGHTILVMSSSYLVNHALYQKAPYDPERSFIPITNMASSPAALVIHPTVPAKGVPELIKLAKTSPGKFNMATPGLGTLPDLSATLLKLTEQVDIATVPYTGAGPALGAVLANQVQIAYMALPTVAPHVQQGRLRALAVAADNRSPAMPDVLTMAEQGFKGHECEIPNGVMVPTGTPPAITQTLYKHIIAILAQPETRTRIEGLNFTVLANTPEQFAAQIRSEVAKWSKVIKSAGIKAE